MAKNGNIPEMSAKSNATWPTYPLIILLQQSATTGKRVVRGCPLEGAGATSVGDRWLLKRIFYLNSYAAGIDQIYPHQAYLRGNSRTF
jgi:hypothetical protein